MPFDSNVELVDVFICQMDMEYMKRICLYCTLKGGYLSNCKLLPHNQSRAQRLVFKKKNGDGEKKTRTRRDRDGMAARKMFERVGNDCVFLVEQDRRASMTRSFYPEGRVWKCEGGRYAESSDNWKPFST